MLDRLVIRASDADIFENLDNADLLGVPLLGGFYAQFGRDSSHRTGEIFFEAAPWADGYYYNIQAADVVGGFSQYQYPQTYGDPPPYPTLIDPAANPYFADLGMWYERQAIGFASDKDYEVNRFLSFFDVTYSLVDDVSQANNFFHDKMEFTFNGDELVIVIHVRGTPEPHYVIVDNYTVGDYGIKLYSSDIVATYTYNGMSPGNLIAATNVSQVSEINNAGNYIVLPEVAFLPEIA